MPLRARRGAPGRSRGRFRDPVAEEACDQHAQAIGRDAEAAPNQELRKTAGPDAVDTGHWTAACETARPPPSNAMPAQCLAWLERRLLSRKVARATARRERGGDARLQDNAGGEPDRTA